MGWPYRHGREEAHTRGFQPFAGVESAWDGPLSVWDDGPSPWEGEEESNGEEAVAAAILRGEVIRTEDLEELRDAAQNLLDVLDRLEVQHAVGDELVEPMNRLTRLLAAGFPRDIWS